MQNNYYFLKQLVKSLNEKIVGYAFQEAFTQEKDELLFNFSKQLENEDSLNSFLIKATLTPNFSSLYFPEDFKRAKKNTVNLFEKAYGKKIKSITQYKNERCFSIDLSGNFQLLFKLFGNRSNIVLIEKDKPSILFNNKFSADKELIIRNLNRKLLQDFVYFKEQNGSYKKLFPTFGKVVEIYLNLKGFKKLEPLTLKWQLIEETVRLLNNPSYYVTKLNDEIIFSLLPIGEVIQEFYEPILALNYFYVKRSQTSNLETEKNAILKRLQKEKKQTETYILANYKRLQELEDSLTNEQKGHILMANLHEILPKSSEANLLSFYTNEQVTIKLKKELSAQKNAESYYRKAKNEKIEIEKIRKNIEEKESKLIDIVNQINVIGAFNDHKLLRNYLKENGLSQISVINKVIKPFKTYKIGGFDIWVGKNAKSNDELTLKYSYKEDLWLHARDASGSHVLLKFQAGLKFPAHVIEKAASLAAYHSKRRSEGLVSVIVTPKKYVRKIKGLAKGQVIVDKEEVLIVAPENLDSNV